ncbi:chromate transporter [Butyrivibrio sp. XPD2006]|uniref:chromate transporter n=1 Tax=Butyrivibrio sp. XPD2006 TaxID=1280668 RepID=UPI0003B33BF2|nr:chromate transporter [Butyrivibrio sp. XPD2006]
MIYLDLLIGFLEVGLFSFGGAYAAIPLIRDVVLAHGWMDDEMISYMIAVSESTPGPIMVNLATYIGSNKGGLLGAVIATTAVVLPAFFIILIILGLAKNLLKNSYAQAILTGLKSCVIGVILATGAYMILGNCGVTSENGIDITAILITCGLAIVYYGMRKVRKNGISPIGLICIAAVVGVAVYGI